MKIGAPPLAVPARSSRRALQRRQHRQDGRRAGAGRQRQTRRDERVGGLEDADQRQADFVWFAVVLDEKDLAEAVELG